MADVYKVFIRGQYRYNLWSCDSGYTVQREVSSVIDGWRFDANMYLPRDVLVHFFGEDAVKRLEGEV